MTRRLGSVADTATGHDDVAGALKAYGAEGFAYHTFGRFAPRPHAVPPPVAKTPVPEPPPVSPPHATAERPAAAAPDAPALPLGALAARIAARAPGSPVIAPLRLRWHPAAPTEPAAEPLAEVAVPTPTGDMFRRL